MIFQFRMLSDEDDNFVRDYEVPCDINLKDFHKFICNDLEYDEYEMTSFFLSDNSWQKLKEFTLEDMGVEPSESDFEPPVLMENTILKNVVNAEHDRLLYVYDIYEDRAYFMELIDIKPEDSEFIYPRLFFSHGTPPDQFDASGSTKNQSIFDEAMDDWGEFSGDDTYEDEY